MRAVRVAHGETHAVRNVDQENDRRAAIVLECGPRLEIDRKNKSRFRVFDTATIGCKSCQYEIAPQEGNEAA